MVVMSCADDHPQEQSQEQPSSEHATKCTTVGCADGVLISLKRAGDTWLPGAYRIAATFDSDSYSCEFRSPEDIPKMLSDDIRVSCEPQSIAHFVLEQKCDGTKCQSVPEHWSVDLTVEGTPETMEVQVDRDGEQVLHQQQSLDYIAVSPNGAGCASCMRAELELAL
jgi:hypothetical protein